MKRKKFINSLLKNIVIWIVSIIMFIPVVLVAINSFKERYEASSMTMSLPKQWHFDNYAIVVDQGKLLQSFLNSSLYSIISVVIVILVTTMAAFVLSRRRS